MPTTDIQNAIIMAAQQAGIDPAWALAVADRESSFNPNEKASKTIHGLFQMTKGLRDKYGIGDSTDPVVQSTGSMKYFQDLKGEMSKVLGRDPTPQELYAGHHFGGVRAARLIAHGDPNTSVSEVFTPYERALNKHIVKAGNIGNLMTDVSDDITRRMAKYSGKDEAETIMGLNPGKTEAEAIMGLSNTGARSAKTPFDYSNFGSDATDDDDFQLPATEDFSISPKKEVKAEPVDEAPEPVMQLQVAPPPRVQPQQAIGSGIPALPSLSSLQLGMKPDEIIKAKPSGLAGALSPLMGTA